MRGRKTAISLRAELFRLVAYRLTTIFRIKILNHYTAPKEELSRPGSTKQPKLESQRDPKAGPSYLDKLKYKGNFAQEEAAGNFIRIYTFISTLLLL